MMRLDLVTLLQIALALTLLLLCLASVAFHWGWERGYHAGREDGRTLTRRPANLRTLGAMWRDWEWDERAETRPYERADAPWPWRTHDDG